MSEEVHIAYGQELPDYESGKTYIAHPQNASPVDVTQFVRSNTAADQYATADVKQAKKEPLTPQDRRAASYALPVPKASAKRTRR